MRKRRTVNPLVANYEWVGHSRRNVNCIESCIYTENQCADRAGSCGMTSAHPPREARVGRHGTLIYNNIMSFRML